MMQKKGKLELTWVGKYEEKVVEPRILVEDKSKSYGDPDTGNMLIHGDNLVALKALEQDFAGKIKCIYIDPPYNTGSAFEHYDDGLEHSEWLNMMKPRLEILRNLLSEDGLIFVQIDDNEQAYLRVLMDEVFSRTNFVASFIWIGRAGKGGTASKVANQHEYIHCYQKTDNAEIKKEKRIADGGNYEDQVGKYKREQLRQWGQGDKREDRPSMWYSIKAPDGANIFPIKDDGTDGRWRVGESKFVELNDANLIDIVKIDNVWKVYRKIRDGRTTESVYSTLLDDFGTSATGTSEIKKIYGSKTFATPKPEKLISHLLMLATNEGDIVLDSFLGSGTTAAVAHKMGRRWIGIELGDHAYTHCKVRMDKVIDGEQGGISKAIGWKGGGGYKFYELAPSLLEKHPELPIYTVNKFYTFEMLCEAICKLEGFRYHPEGEMHGNSSETRFIHIAKDYVSADYVMNLLKNMGEKDSVLIYGTKIQSRLRLPDSVVIKKIPKDLLDKCVFESEVR
jgi:adenine-specific DNA-methyltransferase